MIKCTLCVDFDVFSLRELLIQKKA